MSSRLSSKTRSKSPAVKNSRSKTPRKVKVSKSSNIIDNEDGGSAYTATNAKLYTKEEVALHNTRDDCWIIIAGRVYDVSTFVNDHPGRPTLLIENAGRDGTIGFEEIVHTRGAREMMRDEYYIGNVKAAVVKTWKDFIDDSNKRVIKPISWLIPFLLFIVAVLLGLYFNGYVSIPTLNN